MTTYTHENLTTTDSARDTPEMVECACCGELHTADENTMTKKANIKWDWIDSSACATKAAEYVNGLAEPLREKWVAVELQGLYDLRVLLCGETLGNVETSAMLERELDRNDEDKQIVILRTNECGHVESGRGAFFVLLEDVDDAEPAEEPTDAARDAPEMEFCACCGELHPADELTETAGGDMVCADCIDRFYTKCDHCKEWYPTEELEAVYNDDCEQTFAGLWCSDCIEDHGSVCDDCGLCFTRTYIDDMPSQAHGCTVNICSNCCNNTYVVCESCGELVDIDYAHHRGGAWYCSDCDPCGDYVREYGSTYATRFFALDNENANRVCVPYLGIELETDCSSCFEEAVATLNSAFGGNADLKRDTSIGDSGVEIAAQPQTPAFALSDKSPWSYVLNHLARYGATSHDAGTCGFHIHIDRAFLDAPYMACTLDRLFQTHEDEWRIFSRRTPGQIDTWSKFGSIGCERGLTPKQKREAWDKEKRRSYRYQVVNLSNANTIEIRLWRGTLREKTFRATIEATAALAYLAHDLSETEAEDVELWSWHSLTLHMINTLKKYRLPYVDLLGYLYERGL